MLRPVGSGMDGCSEGEAPRLLRVAGWCRLDFRSLRGGLALSKPGDAKAA